MSKGLIPHADMLTPKQYSEKFMAAGCPWHLLIFPRGCNQMEELSIFLDVAGREDLPSHWQRRAHFSLVRI